MVTQVADYVQCSKCSALRRLPGPLSGVAAPDTHAKNWNCRQNTWEPDVAQRTRAEPATDHPTTRGIDASSADGSRRRRGYESWMVRGRGARRG